MRSSLAYSTVADAASVGKHTVADAASVGRFALIACRCWQHRPRLCRRWQHRPRGGA